MYHFYQINETNIYFELFRVFVLKYDDKIVSNDTHIFISDESGLDNFTETNEDEDIMIYKMFLI